MDSSQIPNSLYPHVIESNSEKPETNLSSSSSLYPSIDMKELVEDLFPDNDEIVENPNSYSPSAPLESAEQVLVTIPGAIVHLIDKEYSVELASGDLTVIGLRQGESVLAVLVRVSDEIQWPLTKDAASVKLDDLHYFFSLHVPSEDGEGGKGPQMLSYGVTIAAKGNDNLLKELDGILEHYSSFSIQKVLENSEALDSRVTKGILATDLKSEKKQQLMEERSLAYWTTLAPNVEEYSGCVAKVIAQGSGKLIQGILWCGDVTVDRLKWGDEFLRKRMAPCKEPSEVSPETLKSIERAKRITRMSEKVATGVLSGVVRVSGYFTSSVANSKVGKKVLGLLPEEVILASLDGFVKVCDAVEVAGRNVMSTTSVVTTGLVSHRHGEKAAEAANEGLDAAGHAIGTAWAVLKIRNAFNPKNALKPTSLAKSAAKTAAAGVTSKIKK